MNNQIIRDPGKFEGEPEYVRTLWEEYVMNGMACREDYYMDVLYSVFILPYDHSDKLIGTVRDDNAHAYACILWEDEQGFVNSAFPTKEEYDAWIKEITE